MYNLCRTVWDLVGVLLIVFGSGISLAYCVEVCILVCNGQNWTKVGSIIICI
jgi:hypothetical protein